MTGSVPKINGTKLQKIIEPLTGTSGGIVGGLSLGSGSALYVNYTSCKCRFQDSGVDLTERTVWDFYNQTLRNGFEPVGIGARITSQLIPTSMFSGVANLNTLSKGIIDAAVNSGPLGTLLPVQILVGSPLRTPDTNRETSVTPAWRNSLWHVIITNVYLISELLLIIHRAGWKVPTQA